MAQGISIVSLAYGPSCPGVGHSALSAPLFIRTSPPPRRPDRREDEHPRRHKVPRNELFWFQVEATVRGLGCFACLMLCSHIGPTERCARPTLCFQLLSAAASSPVRVGGEGPKGSSPCFAPRQCSSGSIRLALAGHLEAAPHEATELREEQGPRRIVVTHRASAERLPRPAACTSG